MRRRYLCKIIFYFYISIASIIHSNAQSTYWWNDAVFYEAFVRSFYDTNGDGIGDLQGLTDKLPYLNELGVNAVWLMPVCASPSYHGYDVTDYRAVEPDYGTTQQYKNFVDSAHKRGIKVVFDYVMNHTSSEHPWFLQSESNDPFYKDFYVWSPTNPGTIGPWGQQVWYYHNPTVGYYYALFWSGMPDLNYNTQAVDDSMFSIAAYWLDSMHVDGFRLDAASYLYEDGNRLSNCPQTLQFWHDFHTYYKGLNDSAMTVGEVWWPTDTILPYVVGSDKLDFCFEFDLATQIINAFNTGDPSGMKSELQYDYDQFPFLQFGTFLTNHDQNRIIDVLSNNMMKMKAAAATYLTLPGIPFIYYGEEIGMNGSGPDENKRRPMQWSNGAHAGFTTANPWESLNGNYTTYNVATEEADSSSLLNWYKKLIAIRHQEVALRRGTYVQTNDAPGSLYSFIRAYQGDTVLVVVNTGNQFFTDFTINMNGTGVAPGYKLLTDLVNSGGWYLADEDAAFNFGTLSIEPYGVLIYLMESSTGIGTIANQSVKIFPNPTSDVITVEMKTDIQNVFVSIRDEAGKIMTAGKKNIQSGNIKIPVDMIPAGIYFLRVEGDDLSSEFRIVVSR